MKTVLYAMFSVALLGCAAPAYQPTTRAGADCKKGCAVGQQQCSGSSMTCDKGYAMVGPFEPALLAS